MSLISDALKEAQKRRDELSNDEPEKIKTKKSSDGKRFILISMISLLIFSLGFLFLYISTGKKAEIIKDKIKIQTRNKIVQKNKRQRTQKEMIPQKRKLPVIKKKTGNDKKSVKYNKPKKKRFFLKKKEKAKKQNEKLNIKKTITKQEKDISKKEKKGKIKIFLTTEKIIGNKTSYLKEAEKAFKERDYDRAIKNYNLALSYSPDDTNILYNLGTAYLLKKQYLLALNEFEKILAKEPYNKKTLFNAGISLFKMGKIEKAKTLWNNLYRIEPDYKDIHYFLGVAEDLTGNYKQAKKHYYYYLSRGKNKALKRWIVNRLKSLN